MKAVSNDVTHICQTSVNFILDIVAFYNVLKHLADSSLQPQ